MQKIPTLQDVARIAGVSTATVSRTLSNPKVVNESTREKVANAVKVSGYRINRAARNLRTQRAQSVLVLLPDLANPFFSAILEGVSICLSAKGYSMLIASTHQVHASGEQLVDYLDDARADGMIVLDGGLSQGVVKSLEDASTTKPVVFACEWIDNGPFPSVRSENRRGTQAAVQYLHALGHTKIAHVTGPEGNVLMHARKEAFVSEINALVLEFNPEWMIQGDFSLEAGCAAAETWIAMHNRPTAVFCASDQIAYGFISELSRHDFQIPKDVSVMGFDDIELSERFIPPLTTVQQDRTQLGKTAAKIVLERLEGIDENYSVVIPVSLIERESTSPPNQ